MYRFIVTGQHAEDENEVTSMAVRESGSTVPRRRLGRLLEQAREDAGVKRVDAAKAIEKSGPTLWRVEAGKVPIRVLEVEALCRLYGVDDAMTTIMKGLASETKAPPKGWWEAYGDAVPDWFDLYVGLEAEARRVDTYEPELVPGLFQTEDYASTLIRADHPDETAEEVERRVQLRLNRQKILTRPIDPPVLRVVLRETVLRTPVGGASIMAAQLDRLVEAAALPNVTLRVVPFSVGFHPGILSGAFSVIRFALNGPGEEREPPTVYSDLYTGAIYVDNSDEVARYERAFDQIWDAALDEEGSQAALQVASEEMRND